MNALTRVLMAVTLLAALGRAVELGSDALESDASEENALSSAELAEVMAEVSGGTGKAALADFLKAYELEEEDHEDADALTKAFEAADRNEDGFVDLKEMPAMARLLDFADEDEEREDHDEN